MTKFKYTLILFLILTITIWGFYLFLFMSKNNQKQEIIQIQEDFHLYEARRDTFNRTVSFLEREEERLDQMDDLFLKTDQQSTVSFIKRIEDLAKRNLVDLNMSNISFIDIEDKRFLTLNLEIIGDWNEVKRTILMLELFPYRISITDLRLRQEMDIWNSILTINVLTNK